MGTLLRDLDGGMELESLIFLIPAIVNRGIAFLVVWDGVYHQYLLRIRSHHQPLLYAGMVTCLFGAPASVGAILGTVMATS